jgi:hypothetical protein
VPSQQDGPDGCSGTTYITAGYKQPNFLMIMVDQMGTPRWLPQTTPPGGGQQIIDGYLTNIAALRNASHVFPNFFAAATACTPSRATLLTGLYSQQTCMFNTLENWCEPGLQPYVYTAPLTPPFGGTGFPTIGNVLTQPLPQGCGGTLSQGYDTVWIGKWHLSATGLNPQTACPGNGQGGAPTPGPTAYGFNDSSYCIPNTTSNAYFNQRLGQQPLAYPSPDGSVANEGAGGALLQPLSGDPNLLINQTSYVYPDYVNPPAQYQPPPYPPTVKDPGYLALSDGGIADAFHQWFTQGGVPTNRPWFCAVSFVNPHDISAFPYGYGLAGVDSASQGKFLKPAGSPPPTVYAYSTPPTPGFTTGPGGADETIPALPAVYLPTTQQGSLPPVGPFSQSWNGLYTDSPRDLQYGPNNGVYGKPDLQLVLQNNSGAELGAIPEYDDNNNPNVNAWYTFLNYYLWMQATVDVQVGRVMHDLNGNSAIAKNTVVIFLSDHGDYAGSHWLHGKAYGLYDETINVPLYIKVGNQSGPVPHYQVCSSVDILPFVYAMSLGNDSRWRQNPGDLVGYLHGRESIFDFIFGKSPKQYRVSQIPTAANAQVGQPYILHTTDEGWGEFNNPVTGNPSPSHAIAFRTVDYSQQLTFPPTGPYGGGKLGIYSFWNYTLGGADGVGPTKPDTTSPPNGKGGPQQFEFYNYSQVSSSQPLQPIYGELGNQAQIVNGQPTGPALAYLNNFKLATVQNELYNLTMWGGGAAPNYITQGQTAALNAYLTYVQSQQGKAPSDTTWQT